MHTPQGAGGWNDGGLTESLFYGRVSPINFFSLKRAFGLFRGLDQVISN